VGGALTGDTIAAGDCFKVVRAQPYGQSKVKYEATGATDFWVPFPASQAISLTSASTPAGSTITRVDDYTLRVDITASSPGPYGFYIDKITNPYSGIQATDVEVKLYKGCGAIAVACEAPK